MTKDNPSIWTKYHERKLGWGPRSRYLWSPDIQGFRIIAKGPRVETSDSINTKLFVFHEPSFPYQQHVSEIALIARIIGVKKSVAFTLMLVLYFSYAIYPFTFLDISGPNTDIYSVMFLQGSTRLLDNFDFLLHGGVLQLFEAIPKVRSDGPSLDGEAQMILIMAAVVNVLLMVVWVFLILRIFWLLVVQLLYLSGYQGMFGARVLYPRDAPNQPASWVGYGE